MKQASRMWVRKYTRPRDEKGRFLPGRQLWTREGGETRWIRVLEPDNAEPRPSLSFNDDALRHLVVLLVVIVAAAVLALVIR